jgi:hypothetical protein
MKFLTIFLLLTFPLNYLQSQSLNKKTIVLLPFVSNGVEESSTKTAESILRMELLKNDSLNVISESKTFEAIGDNECFDEDCARATGQILNTDQSLLCKLNILGEKIIVQYLLIDVKTGDNILVEQATALNLDDLENVVKRIAISVAKNKSFASTLEVGNIVGNESLETLRRKFRYNFGVGFGYLYPQKGYDSGEKSFTLNAYFDHEIQYYAVGLLAGARDGFAINIYGTYLFSKTDICPYLGTSLGIHWVNHDEDYGYYLSDNTYVEPKEKSGNGIELGFKGGVRILHTYNVQLFVNLEYIMTFNDFNDRAIVFTIGIL